MKKILALLSLSAVLLSGCGAPVDVPEPEHSTYIVSGRYYLDGTLITDDGNVWEYYQEVISDELSYDNEPVFAIFDDMGTPDNIYDDETLGLMLDRETAIYDNLEEELSESFVVHRDGNNLTISIKGEGN